MGLFNENGECSKRPSSKPENATGDLFQHSPKRIGRSGPSTSAIDSSNLGQAPKINDEVGCRFMGWLSIRDRRQYEEGKEK